MRTSRFRLVVALALGLAWALVPAPARADQPERKVYQLLLRSTCWILVSEGDRMATGTGWIVDRANRLVVTNYHVVRNKDSVLVLFPEYKNGELIAERDYYLKRGHRIRARVIARQSNRDLALIEVASLPENDEALKLSPQSAGPSDRVHSIGNPGASGALWVYTSGTVRQVYRKQIRYRDFEFEARIIETQSPINPGDSGGPVVNDAGELVGVSAASRQGASLFSYCVDVSEVREFLAEERPAAVPRTAAEYNQRGLAAARKRQYAEAIRNFSEAIRLDPNYALAYAYRGGVHVNTDEPDKAIRDCSEAIRLEPRLALAYVNRGAAYRHKKEYDRAIEDLNEAVRLDPKRPPAYYNRGLSYFEKGDYDQAIEDFSNLIRLEPRSAEAHLLRSRAYRKKGDEARAEEDEKEAQRLKK
jgi:tetratricopeptide (TPR) repeat protein